MAEHDADPSAHTFSIDAAKVENWT